MSRTVNPLTDAIPPQRCTTSDSKLVAARKFYSATYRLHDSICILNDAVKVLSDPDSTPSKETTHVDYIANLIVPTLGLVKDTIEKHAVHVSPIAGVKSICANLEKTDVASIIKPSKRKSECVDGSLSWQEGLTKKIGDRHPLKLLPTRLVARRSSLYNRALTGQCKYQQ